MENYSFWGTEVALATCLEIPIMDAIKQCVFYYFLYSGLYIINQSLEGFERDYIGIHC